MGDTWQYRVRVSGPDRAKWLRKATKDTLGTGKTAHYSWSMLGRFADGKTFPAGGTWYNVVLRKAEEYVELLGNFSGAPGIYFEKKSKYTDRFRHGPALFAGLNITAEVVGHTWHADGPTGIHSYRDVYKRGRRTKIEKSDSVEIAERYAPELLKEFPDDYTPQERSEMAREAAEWRARKAREEAEKAAAKRATWDALRPGAFVEIRHAGKDWMDAGVHRCLVVESVTAESGIFRETLAGETYGGDRLVVKFSEKFSIQRMQVYCGHGRDRRTSAPCADCEHDREESARMVKYMLHGLRARVVL